MKAALNIQVGDRKGCSYLKHSYFTTPFKIANITEDKTQPVLHVMLMSSSPGILDGDVYEINIEVEKNCSMHLHTQAYQRLFSMKQGATQQMNVQVGENAFFFYLPHPSVPHEQSIFTSCNNFYLSNTCCFVFGEILTCGRKLNGEAFLFSKYHSINQIFVHDKLVMKENLLMQPSEINVHAIGQLEGYTHQASMIYLQQNTDIKKLQTAILELLAEEKNIEYGVTLTPVNGLLIRLLGHGAEKLYSCMHRIAAILQTDKTIQYAG